MINKGLKIGEVVIGAGLLAVLAVSGLVLGVAVAGPNPEALVEAELTQLYGDKFYREDPHWRANACQACHRSSPQGDELHLRGDDNSRCTVCHTRGRASREPHPVGGSAGDRVVIPAGFPLDVEDKITCRTCHDHTPACQRRDRKDATNLLRPAPAPVTGEPELLSFCYSCHLREDIEGYNPHERQLHNGEIEPRRCLFCHSRVLDPREELENREYHLRKEMSVICIGCHLLTPHAGAAEHLERPSDKTLAAMQEAQRELGVVFPLDEKGRVACATCHNPHESAIFPVGHPAGVRYDEEELPPEVVRKYEELAVTDQPVRRSFRLGVPDFRAKLRPVSELKPERNMRLPARDGTLCAACHGAGGIDR